MRTSHTPYVRRAIIPLLSLLILTTGIIPLAAAAPITLTPSKTTYNPSDTLVVSGTATPNSAVTIQVYNPATNRVGIGQGSTDANGQYTITVFTWPAIPTLTIPFGIYSIKATDSANGDTAETTVEYAQVTEAPPEVPVVEGALVQITVSTSSTYQLGDTARIFVAFSYNGAKVAPTATTLNIVTPGFSTLPRSLTLISKGLYYVDYTPTATGTYAVQVAATAQGTSNVEITSFQVSEPLATETGLETLSADLDEVQQSILNRIGSAQSAIEGSISSVQNSINGLDGAISSAKSDLDSRIGSAQSDIKSSITSSENSIKSQITSSEQAVKSAIDGIQSAVTSAVNSAVQPLRSDVDHVDEAVDAMAENIESTNAGVSAASTWIIVVGIIAAITLVLELVTLVRKLS